MTRNIANLAKGLTAALAAATLLVTVGGPMTPVSDASAATSISGTVFADGYRAAGATVRIWAAWPGASWQHVRTVSTDGSGRYSVTGLADNRYFVAEGLKTFGRCFVGTGITYYQGWGNQFFSTSGARGSNVYMGAVNWVGC